MKVYNGTAVCIRKLHSCWVMPIVVHKVLTMVIIFVALASVYLYNDALPAQSLERDQATWRSQLSYLDGIYYLRLARDWYSPGDEVCAFYPLWPWLIRTASPFFGGDLLVTGLLLASCFSVAGMFLFYELVAKQAGEDIAERSLILLAAFPGAIFFSLLYTESLFFFLSMLFFHGLFRQRMWMTCLSGFLLPMTRAVGIFILLPLVWHLFWRGWRRWATGNGPTSAHGAVEIAEKAISEETTFKKHAPRWLNATPALKRFCDLLMCLAAQRLWLGLMAILAGYASYLAIMFFATGNPFEGFSAQRKFPALASVANIVNLGKFWRSFRNVGAVHGQLDSAIDRMLFLLFLATLPKVWRLDRSYFFYVLGMGLLPVLSNGFMSYTRFVELCFPMFIVLAGWLAGPTKRLLLWYYVALAAVTQGVFLIRNINFHWAG
jgi:hypothetical protein